MMDSSPFDWLEERGPRCHLIAMIDDATSQAWGRLVEHDSTEENLRTLGGWIERHGRPLALYTDKNSLFVTSRPAQWHEQLQDKPARTQFGRALAELDIDGIAAHSPQAKGRISVELELTRDILCVTSSTHRNREYRSTRRRKGIEVRLGLSILS